MQFRNMIVTSEKETALQQTPLVNQNTKIKRSYVTLERIFRIASCATANVLNAFYKWRSGLSTS